MSAIETAPRVEPFFDKDFFLTLCFSLGIIQFGGFETNLHRKHPEAPLAPLSFNIRDVQGSDQLYKLTARGYVREIERIRRTPGSRIEMIAGVPNAMSVLLGSIKERLGGLPSVTPNFEPKAIGIGQQIAGLLPQNEGKETAVLEDVWSTGETLMKAIDTLRNVGKLPVRHAVVALDRSNGYGKRVLWKKGVELHSLVTADQVLTHAVANNIIDFGRCQIIQRQLSELNRFIQDLDVKEGRISA